jgi:hypothetical protein
MKQNENTKQAQKKTPERETLKERVHRHLTDINSEITDDDIRSARTELEIRTNDNAEPLDKNNEESKANTQNRQITTWDELSEGYD